MVTLSNLPTGWQQKSWKWVYVSLRGSRKQEEQESSPQILGEKPSLHCHGERQCLMKAMHPHNIAAGSTDFINGGARKVNWFAYGHESSQWQTWDWWSGLPCLLHHIQLSPCWPEALCLLALTYWIEIVMQGVEHKSLESRARSVPGSRSLLEAACNWEPLVGSTHLYFFTLECLVLKA